VTLWMVKLAIIIIVDDAKGLMVTK